MLFAIHCLDREDADALRRESAAAHAAYMRIHADRVMIGGPLLSEDGARRIGVLIIGEFPDRAAVSDFLAQEPYCRTGLFRQVAVNPYAIVMNGFSSGCGGGDADRKD